MASVSLMQACAQTQEAIARMRSLFGSAPAPDSAAATSAARMTGAVHATTNAGSLTGELSGAFVDAHRTFVRHAAGVLGSAARSDATLSTHLGRAAVLTQAGADRLDAIAAQTRATSQAAATVSTPAAERAVMSALHSQLTQASGVVNSTQQQAAGLAGQVRALTYDNVTRGPLPQSPQPAPPPPNPSPPHQDPLTQLMMPPATPPPRPVSGPLQAWVDNMVRELAARPPDDPIAVEARRMAWEALHKPQLCSTWQWSRDAGGLLLSLAGAGVTIAGAPLGPADWAALGIALGGAGLSYGDLIDCATR